MKALLATLALLGLGLTACAPPPAPEPNPLEAPPVDSARVRSVEEAAGWGYSQMVEADLDGDGNTERLVLAADVVLGPGGAPLWEDGHRWAAFVEDGGERTLLYAAFVPNGHAEAAVLGADSEGQRHVLIEERTPQQARSLVVAYERSGTARSVSGAYYQIERWLPALVEP